MKLNQTFFSILLFSFFVIAETAAQSEDLNLTAPDGSTVTIERDTFGVPHISSETEVGVFFGQGLRCGRIGRVRVQPLVSNSLQWQFLMEVTYSYLKGESEDGIIYYY